jgi:hypothetical protein
VLPTSHAPTNTVPVVNGRPGKWLRSFSKETYIALLAALGVTWYLIGRYLLHAPLRSVSGLFSWFWLSAADR